MRKGLTTAVAMAAILIIAAPSANASLTTWYASPNEPNLDQVLERLYGMGNLERIDDSLDQLWTNTAGTAWAKARYASQTPTFGFLPDAIGGSFNDLFTVVTQGENPTYFPSGAVSFPPEDTGDPFRFALESENLVWSSLVTDNDDGGGLNLDHMITFQVTGSDLFHDNDDILGNYVFAWEDRCGPYDLPVCDRDFQDMIVEVYGVSPWEPDDPEDPDDPDPPEVPEPATILLLGLGGLGGLARRLRRRGGTTD
jgi:hypothetical protein